MLDQLVGYLNLIEIRPGELLLLVVVVCWCIRQLRDIHKKYKSGIETELEKKEKIQSLFTQVADAQRDITNLRDEFGEKLQELVVVFNHYSESRVGERNEIETAIADLNRLTSEQNQRLLSLEGKILKIEGEIEVLFLSDKEYMHAYITEAHNRYVKTEHQIDLLTLQSIESVYSRYLEEGGDNDKFLAKLITELRNLPTSKAKKKVAQGE